MSNNTRWFLAILTGLAVLYFGSDGNDARGPTSAVVVLAVVAALVVFFVTRPRNPGPSK